MACPFFMPTRKFEDGAWLHPSRLPLGSGWHGLCTASDQQIIPSDEELREFCNLGYAANCPHLPSERVWDAVRFSVARDCEEGVLMWYACESDHRPAEHGTLEYNAADAAWIRPHGDARIQKMAECYLDSYLRKTRAAVAACTSS